MGISTYLPSSKDVSSFSIEGVSHSSSEIISLPVLYIFWARPSVIPQTLDFLLASKPTKILFYQNAPLADGSNAADHRHCRQMIDAFIRQIDWPCEVLFWTPQDCLGVWESIYRAVQWAFSLNDQCAVLEEDCAPSSTWLRFASFLLDKYENNNQISYVYSELNCEVAPEFSDKYDYLFSRSGSIHAWASWARVVRAWDTDYSWLEDRASFSKIAQVYGRKQTKAIFQKARDFKNRQKPEMEIYMGCFQALHASLNIIPTKNMLANNGISGENSAKPSLLTKKMKRYFSKKCYQVSFPLREPPEFLVSVKTDKKIISSITLNFKDKIELFFLYAKNHQVGFWIRKKLGKHR
jgi:hypothetical protein